MRRPFSLALLFCSLTLCHAYGYAQTWCVSDSTGGAKPKIAVDNESVARILWLQSNPVHGGANDVFYARFDPIPNTWTKYNWSNDSYNQHACDIEYDRFSDCRWIAYDDPDQLHVVFYSYPDSITHSIAIFDTLLPLDTTMSHPFLSPQVNSRIVFASNDVGTVVVTWPSDSIVRNQAASIIYKCIHDTTLGTTQLVLPGKPYDGWFGTAHYPEGVLVHEGTNPVFIERYEANGFISYGYNLGYTSWKPDSNAWIPSYYAGEIYSMGGVYYGSPATNIGITHDSSGKQLVVFASALGPPQGDTIWCMKFDQSSGALDTTYVIISNTPFHSGAVAPMTHPTLVWSDGNNIYLHTYYDSLWSAPPKRINPVGIDSCINPDIDFDRDSTVWVSYESQGRIYVTRTSVPLGVSEKTTVQIQNPKSKISLKSWPNPARNVVHFSYTLPSKRNSSVSVYDIAGRLVKTLDISGNQADWDCADNAGRKVASGVYFARLKSGGQETIQRISIIK